MAGLGDPALGSPPAAEPRWPGRPEALRPAGTRTPTVATGVPQCVAGELGEHGACPTEVTGHRCQLQVLSCG